MSFIVTGADFPKTCSSCPCCQVVDVSILENYCGALRDNPIIMDVFNSKLSNCPLVELPTPRGRLIDADELLKAFKKACEQDKHWVNFFALVESAPTVIEAETVEK